MSLRKIEFRFQGKSDRTVEVFPPYGETQEETLKNTILKLGKKVRTRITMISIDNEEVLVDKKSILNSVEGDKWEKLFKELIK